LEELARRQDAGEPLTTEEQARLEAAQARLQEVGEKAAAIAGSIFSGRRENRSEDEYRQEVEDYLRAARESIAQAVVSAAMKGGLIRLQPVLSNHIERNFPKVEVELCIAAPVLALDDDSDAEGLPPRPRLFGALRPSPSFMAGAITTPRLPRTPASSRIRIPRVVIDNGASARLRFRPVDLRPKRQEQLDAFHLVVRAELAGQTLPVSWTATSSGADGLVSGSLAVEVRSTSAKPSELLDLTSDN
jgi:hypothetical protein